jgi:predicted tellurium resistance membrane protein TerC
MEALLTPDVWISLATLTLMEIVLGIDNIVFISILSGRLPLDQQPRARTVGLSVALLTRLGLLFAISWVMGLTEPLFTVLGKAMSGRDLILLGGGLFLLAKATHEIHEKLEVEVPDAQTGGKAKGRTSFWLVIGQIMVLDIVFSLDSVITAVGMAPMLAVMVTAMVLSVGVMLVFAGFISEFVNRHPTMKMLALSFLLLIGVLLVVEGMGQHIDKGYIYFAMAFSLGVELLNLRMRKAQPLQLHGTVEMPGGKD